MYSAEYGATVKPFDPEVQKKCIGDAEVITCRPASIFWTMSCRLWSLRWHSTKSRMRMFCPMPSSPQVATDFFKYRDAQKTKVDAAVADTENGAYPV